MHEGFTLEPEDFFDAHRLVVIANPNAQTGVELLIHVGLDTVNLNGKYYEALVKDGDAVEVGTPILKVNLEGIKSEGYDIITPVIVTNTMDCGEVIAVSEGDIMPQETIIKVMK